MSRIEFFNNKAGLKAVRLYNGNCITTETTVIVDKKGNEYAVYSTLPSNVYEHATITIIRDLPKGFKILQDSLDIFY